MKNRLFSFLLLISFVSSVSAQMARSDLVEQNLRKHVSYLASNNLEGRRTGEKGATSAAGYVANMFANYKLKGGFAGKGTTSFLQHFPFTTAVSLGAENRLMVTTAGNNLVADLKEAWIPFGASPNADIPGTDAVFVGDGIVSSEQSRDDYAGRNVVGKIVFAFDDSPDKDDPRSILARFGIHAKAKIAKDKGAIALVIISRETNFANDKSIKLDYDPTLGETAIPVVIAARSVGALMFGGEPEMLKAEKGEKTETKQVKTLLKVNLSKKSGQSYNVIGVLEGTDFNLKNEALVIGAHYDHLGRGGAGSLAANSTEIHHGADDNASGVAALIEIARQFSMSKTNKRTLIFIAFGGEEEGLLGSKYYVNNPAFPLVKTVAMINMDMVGRLKDDKLTIGGIGTASEWKSLIESRNVQQIPVNSLPSSSLSLPQNPVTANSNPAVMVNPAVVRKPAFTLQLNEDGFGPSDHSSFYGKQIPVLFFFTGTHLDYHKPTDTAEKINFTGLNQITNYVAEIIKSIDANSKRPTYTIAKSSGMSGGRTGFSVSLGTIPSYAESNDGLVLDGVRDASPAAKAGLKANDKIIKLAGKEIRNVSDYTVVLGEMKAGVEYEIVIVRGTEKLNLKIIPAARK